VAASLTANNPAIACNQLIDQTYYYTGQGALPVVGDIIYTDIACSGTATILQSGFYKFNTNQVMEVNVNGVVILINNC
jgi:hypothetical protein